MPLDLQAVKTILHRTSSRWLRSIHPAQTGAIQPKGDELAASRSTASKQVLMLKASDQREERVEALDHGADDRSVRAAIPQT